MAACPACGVHADAAARFCASCGAPLGVPPVRDHGTQARQEPQEGRRTVTVLFCDLVSSTELVERFDPERVRALQGRYAASARDTVEAYGGVVEKFVGDAVMAVFGIPRRHEDDAARACRAAADLVRSVHALSSELNEPLQCRIGIATGEVVTTADVHAGEQFVTGVAVNRAARIQGAAAPDEVWLDEATADRVRRDAELEPVGMLSLKGLATPVAGFRLLASARASREPPQIETALVGRDRELERLRGVLTRIRTTGRPELAVVMGDAGVGKSRLCHELVVEARATRVSVLRARCLPHGKGVTFAPIAELFRAAAGISPDESDQDATSKVGKLLSGIADEALLGERVESLLGVGRGGQVPLNEMTWVVQQVLQHLVERRATLITVDDIQWAEPPLLDLLGELAIRVAGPLMIVAVARPEFEESGEAWLAQRPEAVIRLGALADDVTGQLIDGLFPGRAIDPAVRDRIATIGAGNALFVEQYAAMLVESGVIAEQTGEIVARHDLADVPVPTSIGDLLATRLDALPVPERRVAEHGSIAGRVFWRSSLDWLTEHDEQPTVEASLTGLLRRELVLADRSDFEDDAAFRFRHLLVRDAAYATLTKRERASLHRRFASWLETKPGTDTAESAALIGYHYEQAYLYALELGSTDRGAGSAAAARLAEAGLSAYERDDLNAAAGLFERAARTTDDLDRALRLRLRSARCAWGTAADATGRDAAASVVEQVHQEAAAAGLAALTASSRVAVAELHWRRGALTPDQVAAEADAAIPILRGAGQPEDLANALMLRSDVSDDLGDWASTETNARAADEIARESGLSWLRARTASFASYFSLESWTPVANGLEELDRLGDGQSDRVIPGLPIECRRAVLLAADGRLGEADAALDRARVLLTRTDASDLAVWIDNHLFEIHEIRGNHVGAVAAGSAVIDAFRAHGEGADVTVAAGDLAHAHLHLGQLDEALRVLSLGRPPDPEGPASAWLWYGTAEVWAESFVGDAKAALARAKNIASRATDRGRWHWEERAQETILEIARRAGSRSDELAAIVALRSIYERKGHRAGLSRLDHEAISVDA